MAPAASFDITSPVDLQEVDNAVNQAQKEIAQRYDFKGSKAAITFKRAEALIEVVADDRFKMDAVWEILQTRLCAQAGGTEYISGLSAKDYIVESVFGDRGIRLTWFDYANYPEYPQLWGEFVHGVTILDLLFNCGKEAPRYMKHVRS